MRIPRTKLSPVIAKAKAKRRAEAKQKQKSERLAREDKEKAHKAQLAFVGLTAEALATREYRKFSTNEILSILKEYNNLPDVRGLRKTWLAERKLTTAHIAIWRRKLRTGDLVD